MVEFLRGQNFAIDLSVSYQIMKGIAQPSGSHVDEPPDYYAGLNLHLLRAVPSQAKGILDVGCGNGQLGEQLKTADSDRFVFGVEREPEIAQVAANHLDKVYILARGLACRDG